MGVLQAYFSPDISSELRLYKYQDLTFMMLAYREKSIKGCRYTSERIDRYQDSANIGVYFRVRPSLLEILIDAFVAYRGE